MKTYSPKPRDIERRWYVIDADGVVLGRLASEVAAILKGKHKPIYAPHADTGDHVIVVNASGVRLTGGKEAKKIAYRHSGYPGGLTEIDYGRLMSERPKFAVEKAVKGMLPKNTLGRSMFKKLSVYDGAEHPHAAQKPEALALGDVPPWGGLPQAAPAAKPAAEKKPATKPAATRTAGAKPASTSTAKTTPAAKKPATAKKPAARTSPATKSGAKKSTAKKPAAKRSTAKPKATKAGSPTPENTEGDES